MLHEAARLMRGVARRPRRASARVYRRAGRPCPRCGTPIRSRGQGDDNRTAYWCPELPKRRGGAPARSGHSWPCVLRTSIALCAASVLRASRCSRTMSPAETSSRSHSRSTLRVGPARCTSTGRSPARTSRRAAERLSALADAKLAIEDLRREPAAAIYAAAHSGKAGDQPLLRTIVLPLLADVADGCGGFDWSDEAFDRRVRRARALAARQAPHLRSRRAARRSLARHAGGARRRPAAPRRRRGRAGRPLARGERPAAARGSAASPTGSVSSSSSAPCFPTSRAPPTRRARSPTQSARCAWRLQRRSPRGRCCSSDSTGGRWRSARCCRSPPPSRPASPRGSTPSVRGSPRTCSRGSGAPRRIRSSRRRSIAGSCRCSRTSRSARSSCAKLCPRCSAARTGCGRPRCGRRCCSARPRATGPSSSSAFAGSRVARRRERRPPMPCARRSWRRSRTAIA